jgi:hypothetical protein
VALRAAWPDRHLPAIMITGSSLGRPRGRSRTHDYHLLIKPVLPNKLRAMIAFKLLAVRAAVGMALVIAAPGLPASGLLRLFGGVLLATTLVMAMLPWRWHQRFSAQRVPRALSFLGLIGGVSLAAGLGLLAAAWQGLAR